MLLQIFLTGFLDKDIYSLAIVIVFLAAATSLAADIILVLTITNRTRLKTILAEMREIKAKQEKTARNQKIFLSEIGALKEALINSKTNQNRALTHLKQLILYAEMFTEHAEQQNSGTGSKAENSFKNVIKISGEKARQIKGFDDELYNYIMQERKTDRETIEKLIKELEELRAQK